jgi:hypothetical protein
MKRFLIAMILGLVSGTASEAADKPVKVCILAGHGFAEAMKKLLK